MSRSAASTPGVGGVEFGARMTECKCGHAAIEHYDSHLFCTWTTADPPKCECEEFDAAGPEVWIKVGGSDAGA